MGIRTRTLGDADPMFEEKESVLGVDSIFREAHTDSIRLLAIGSSRIQLGFHAGLLEKTLQADGHPVEAFNFGTPAAGPVVCSLYLRRLLEEGVHLDHLFIEFHPGFLTPLQPVFEGRWLQPYRLRPHEVALIHSYGWDIPTPDHHGWRGWFLAASAYRFPLLNRYAHKWLPCPYGLALGTPRDRNGWFRGPEYKPDEYAKLLHRAWIQYEDTFEDFHIGGPGCAAMRDMLTVCRDHGIRATIVIVPEADEYREWYGENASEIDRFAGELTAEFGVPVIDARDWLVREEFSDGHHPTPEGAEKLTRRLAYEWEQLYTTNGDSDR